MKSKHRFDHCRIPALLVCGLLFAALAQWPIAYAEQVTVCAKGCDYSDIQSAVNGARSGDSIKIRSGIFPEKVTIAKKSLKLTGEGATRTIIDGTSREDGRPVVELVCQAGVDILIADLAITGGMPYHGFGGGGIVNGCRLTLESVIVTNNAARAGGGVLNSGSLEVYDSVIGNNAAFDLSGGGIENNGDLFIDHSTITNNSARNGGGGIANSGTMFVQNSIVSNNNARLGGGIAVTMGSSEAELREVAIIGNTATQKGGGIWNGAQLEIKAGLIMGNSASGVLTDRWGGGLFNDADGILAIRNTSILRNHADDEGGGIYNNSGAISLLGTTTVTNNTPNNCSHL